MKAARHSSVSAHLEYQETGQVSEGHRIKCLLDARPDKEKNPGPSLKVTTPKTVLLPSTPRTTGQSRPGTNCSHTRLLLVQNL